MSEVEDYAAPWGDQTVWVLPLAKRIDLHVFYTQQFLPFLREHLLATPLVQNQFDPNQNQKDVWWRRCKHALEPGKILGETPPFSRLA